jgi:hypothetical protein
MGESVRFVDSAATAIRGSDNPADEVEKTSAAGATTGNLGRRRADDRGDFPEQVKPGIDNLPR